MPEPILTKAYQLTFNKEYWSAGATAIALTLMVVLASVEVIVFAERKAKPFSNGKLLVGLRYLSELILPQANQPNSFK